MADDLNLGLLLGRAAVGLSVGQRQVVLDDGSVIGYDGLVIATGAAAVRLPGTERYPTVHVLRTLDDAVALRNALRPGVRVAVVGAGSWAARSRRRAGTSGSRRP